MIEIDPSATLSSIAIDVDKCFGIEFGRFQNLNVFCPWCEDPEKSDSPSCSVSKIGMFVCKSCGMKGTALDFFMKWSGTTDREQAHKLVKKPKSKKRSIKHHKATPISDQLVQRCHETLLRSTAEMAYLMSTRRGLTLETINEYELGMDETRITLPIREEDGNLYGIRRYLIKVAGDVKERKRLPKFVKHEGGGGGAKLYPAQNIRRYMVSDEPYIVLDEGEFDTLIAIQNGFDTLTVTSTVAYWEEEFTQKLLMIGKPVVIIYDLNDKDDDFGQRIAWQRAEILHAAGLKVKVVRLPLKEYWIGGDMTNFFSDEKQTAARLREVIEETPDYGTEEAQQQAMEPPPSAPNDPVNPLVNLHDASKADYFFKPIRLRCLVAGKGQSPYFVPSKIQVEVADEEKGIETFEHTFEPGDSILLSLIQCTTPVQKRLIKSLLGIDPKSQSQVTILESMNIEEVYLIPAIDLEKDQGPYVLRQAFYIGHGLEANKVYEFTGYTLPDPRTQAATHVLTEAAPSETDLDSFRMTPELNSRLSAVFKTDDVNGQMDHIAEQLAIHTSKIYGRSDLHQAIDLVLHSPLQFDFGGNRVRKGWLECLVIGDTRTGKGQVTESLCRYYGVGEIISGEDLTFAGLIGGIGKVGERNVLQWGKIPLNDKRALVLDECGGMSRELIGKLSRIRSEGVAETTKIISEKTTARTRLIWLGNIRPPPDNALRKMEDYTYGIQAVPELIGTAEDVARFDFVLVVAQNEVPSKDINKERPEPKIEDMEFTPELCRSLVVWAWSRKPEQIIFTPGTEKLILQAAIHLGQVFTPKICLIQSEDIRFKVARIACAAACRTFSTDDGETVLINEEHVKYAYNFLYHIYSKTCCGYLQMSAHERERATLRSKPEILNILQSIGNNDTMLSLINYFLDQRHITASDMGDYTGMDPFEIRRVVSELIRGHAITKEYTYYVKKPAFRTYLQELKSKMSTDSEYITQSEDTLEPDDQPEGAKDASSNGHAS